MPSKIRRRCGGDILSPLTCYQTEYLFSVRAEYPLSKLMICSQKNLYSPYELLQVLVSNKNICMLLVSRNRNEILIWIWNNPTLKTTEGLTKLEDIKGKFLYGQCTTCGFQGCYHISFGRIWLILKYGVQMKY